MELIYYIYHILFTLMPSFSWPCLHQWLETRPTKQVCPVCKAAISKEKVIPLYGRGATKQEDPRFVNNDVKYNLVHMLHVILFLKILFNA